MTARSMGSPILNGIGLAVQKSLFGGGGPIEDLTVDHVLPGLCVPNKQKLARITLLDMKVLSRNLAQKRS